MNDWSALLVVSFTLYITASAQSYSSRRSRDASRDPLWTTWSRWTPCSMSCGQGTRSRYRGCVRRTSAGLKRLGDENCEGRGKVYELCETESCPPGDADDVRDHQCAQHNAEVFSNRTYEWVPFTSGTAPCDLGCMAAGYAFYNNFGKVTDGTPCGQKDKRKDGREQQICVNGKCEVVGCDGIVGSGAKEDKCKVCGGHNNDCYHYRNSFLDLDPPKEVHQQYQPIVMIPQGSTHIEMTDSSSNYLALAHGGTYILNGNWMIDWPGTFDIAGTQIEYKRKGRTEILTIEGPTTQNLTVMLLFKERNPGVHFEFYLPTSKIDQIVIHKDIKKTIRHSPHIPSIYLPPKYGSSSDSSATVPPIPPPTTVKQPVTTTQSPLKKTRKTVGIEIPLAMDLNGPVNNAESTDFGLQNDRDIATGLEHLENGYLSSYLTAYSSNQYDTLGEHGIPLQSSNTGGRSNINSGGIPLTNAATGGSAGGIPLSVPSNSQNHWSQWSNNYNYALYGPQPQVPPSTGVNPGNTQTANQAWDQFYQKFGQQRYNYGTGGFTNSNNPGTSSNGNDRSSTGLINPQASLLNPNQRGSSSNNNGFGFSSTNILDNPNNNARSPIINPYGPNSRLHGTGFVNPDATRTANDPYGSRLPGNGGTSSTGSSSTYLSGYPRRGESPTGVGPLPGPIIYPTANSQSNPAPTDRRIIESHRPSVNQGSVNFGSSSRLHTGNVNTGLTGNSFWNGFNKRGNETEQSKARVNTYVYTRPTVPAIRPTAATTYKPRTRKPRIQDRSFTRKPNNSQGGSRHSKHTADYIISNKRKTYLEYYKKRSRQTKQIGRSNVEAHQPLEYGYSEGRPAVDIPSSQDVEIERSDEGEEVHILDWTDVVFDDELLPEKAPKGNLENKRTHASNVMTTPTTPIVNVPDDDEIFDFLNEIIENSNSDREHTTRTNLIPRIAGEHATANEEWKPTTPKISPMETKVVPKSTKTKKQKCSKCSKPKLNMRKSVCDNEIVGKIRVLNSKVIGNRTRYSVVLDEVYKGINLMTSKQTQLWTDNPCRCPRLKSSIEYLIMASVIDDRISVSPQRHYVKRYKQTHSKKVPKLIKNCS